MERSRIIGAPSRLVITLGLSLLALSIGGSPAAVGAQPEEELRPTLAWTRVLGGAGDDLATRVVTTVAGEVWVAGRTSDAASWDGGQARVERIGPGGGTDAFVARLSAGGDLRLLVFIGGSGRDEASGLAVTPDGDLIVVGATSSADLPTSEGAFQRTLGGSRDAFAIKLTAGGSLAWSTLLGGSDLDSAAAAAVLSDGGVVVCGTTWSSDFPAVDPLHEETGSFLAVLSADGAQVAFSTRVPGLWGGFEEALDLAVSADDEVIIVGRTPTETGFCSYSGLAVKLRARPRGIAFAASVGGSGVGSLESVALAGDGEVVVLGGTDGKDVPWATDAVLGPAAAWNAFVATLAADGSATYTARMPWLGGLGAGPAVCFPPPSGSALAVDGAGRIWVAGRTTVPFFPTLNPLRATLAGGTDGFVAVLGGGGSPLLFSTFLGGERSDRATDIAATPAGAAFITGATESGDFPGAPTAERAGPDVFVTRIDADGPPLTATAAASPASGLAPLRVSLAGSASGGSGLYSWEWDFGDGSERGSGREQCHLYTLGRPHTATLTVTDSRGATATAAVQIDLEARCEIACTASAPLAAPAFAGSPLAPVQFSASASVSPDCPDAPSYRWTFGDGATSSEQSPLHFFPGPGAFGWTMTASVRGNACRREGTLVVTTLAEIASSQVVPAVAHRPGFFGSRWRTDIGLVNPAPATAAVTLVYMTGGPPVIRTMTVPPGAGVELADVLVSAFGLAETDASAGAVHVVSDRRLAANGRTYNDTEQGTFGQAFPALRPGDGIGAGDLGIVTQLKKNEAFRTNLGLVNAGTSPAEVRVRLHAAGGPLLGERTLVVQAGRWLQVDDIFTAWGIGPRDLAHATVEVLTPGARVWAYGAVVDNATGDPTTIPVVVP